MLIKHSQSDIISFILGGKRDISNTQFAHTTKRAERFMRRHSQKTSCQGVLLQSHLYAQQRNIAEAENKATGAKPVPALGSKVL